MLFSIGATEDAAWRRSAAAGSDRIIAGWGTERQLEEPLGVAGRGRRVLVLEVAVDVDSGCHEGFHAPRPGGEGSLVVGRLAQSQIPERRAGLEEVDASG